MKIDYVPKKTPKSMLKMLARNGVRPTGVWAKDVIKAREVLGMKRVIIP
jgi:hypothetical protein